MTKRYTKKAEQYAPVSPTRTINVSQVDSPKLFRGFIPGGSIRTKKGFIGQGLDSLWARHLFASFKSDDDELATIAMKSCIADKNAVIEGGEFGCPFFLGNYGIHTISQFSRQELTLKEHERNLLKDDHRQFLSDNEWNKVDSCLSRCAVYGDAMTDYVAKGDTLLMLAIRFDAFAVARLMISLGVDPILKNEDDVDALELLRQRYSALTTELLEINNKKVAMAKITIVPTEFDDLMKHDMKTCEKVREMLKFLELLQSNLRKRVEFLDKDKWSLKVAELKNLDISFDLKWRISQEENLQRLLKMSIDMWNYADEKLQRHEQQHEEINLESVLKCQQALLHNAVRDNRPIKVIPTALSHINHNFKGTKAVLESKSHLTTTAKAQVTYTMDDDGNKQYEITSLSNVADKAIPIVYIKEKTKDSVIMYR